MDRTDIITQSLPVQERPLFCFLGSSVTYGFANGGASFVEEIANTLRCVCVKEAVNGTTLANNGESSYVARMLKGFDRNAKIEQLIVQLSTNDASQNMPRGSISTAKDAEAMDASTTLGAIEFIITYAKKTWNCEVTFYTNPPYQSEAYRSLVNDLYAIREKWGIGIVDFYRYGDMPPLDDTTLASYMSDDIHPNAQGYRWMGKIFCEYLRGSYAKKIRR